MECAFHYKEAITRKDVNRPWSQARQTDVNSH